MRFEWSSPCYVHLVVSCATMVAIGEALGDGLAGLLFGLGCICKIVMMEHVVCVHSALGFQSDSVVPSSQAAVHSLVAVSQGQQTEVSQPHLVT